MRGRLTFSGFSKDTARFLAALSRNNDRAWFDAHRADYEAYFVEPAKQFVEALAPRLLRIDSRLRAIPKVNGSILRINRDIRFSKDKTPYKDHLDLWFWSGPNRGWDGSGFFFRLTSKRLILGSGMHVFAPPVLARYRRAVLDDKLGAALSKLLRAVTAKGYALGGETYKKTPQGVEADHPRAALLRHSGLHATWEAAHPKQLGSAAFVEFVAKHFAAMAPLYAWLAKV